MPRPDARGTDRLANSEFWRDMANKFRTLDPSGCVHLTWKQYKNGGFSYDVTSAQRPGCAYIKHQFMALAARCAITLANRNTSSPLDLWINLIITPNDAKYRRTGSSASDGGPVDTWVGGFMEDASEVCAQTCTAFEIRELEKERLLSIPQEPLSDDPLEALNREDFGLELGTETQNKIRAELRIIVGKKAQGLYPDDQSQKHLYDAYHNIANAIVDANTSDEVLEKTIPGCIDNCRFMNFWTPRIDSHECLRLLIDGPATEWRGLRDRMRLTVKGAAAQAKAETKAIDPDSLRAIRLGPTAEEAIEAEALRQFLIAKRVQELAASETETTLAEPSAGPSAAQRASDEKIGFPNRAAWMKDRLTERGWDKNSLYPMGGPDRKTVQKLLDGRYVRAEVLSRTVAALNHQKINGLAVKLTDIPND